MGVEETALELIGYAYDAALAPEKWQILLERMIKVLGTRSASLRENSATGQVGIFETIGFNPAYIKAYREYFVHLDYYAPLLRNTPVGIACIGSEAIPLAQQRKTEFFNDYFKAQGIHYAMGCILARSDQYDLLFAMQREIGQPDFSDKDMRLIQLVTPHMVRATQIHHQMAELTAEKRWALSALDLLRVGVILLDEHGRSVFINREADRIANGANGFVAGRDGLALPSAKDTASLRWMIAAAAGLATGRAAGIPGGGCLRITGNGGATLQFQVIPLPRDLSDQAWGDSQCNGCVAVLVSTTGGPHLPWQQVAAMHGLTRAEARLASLLADGISLEEAAATLLISIQTVRSQLKSVFAKTGVTRQAELVALLLADMLTDRTDIQA